MCFNILEIKESNQNTNEINQFDIIRILKWKTWIKAEKYVVVTVKYKILQTSLESIIGTLICTEYFNF